MENNKGGVQPQEFDDVKVLESYKETFPDVIGDILSDRFFYKIDQNKQKIINLQGMLMECLKEYDEFSKLKLRLWQIRERFKASHKSFVKDVDRFIEQKKNWLKIQEQIQKDNPATNDIIKLSIGGKEMVVGRNLLRSVPGSHLADFFSGQYPVQQYNDAIFLDRDTESFRFLINFLRSGRNLEVNSTDQIQNQIFLDELKYWGIKSKKEEQEMKRLEAKIPKIVDILTKTPSVSQFTKLNETGDYYKRWRELGPLSVHEINRHSPINLSTDLIIQKSNVYTGQLDQNERLEGIGRIVWTDYIYEGQYANDKRCGFGRLITNNEYYVGMWKENQKHGHGKLVKKDGTTKEGTFEHDEFLE
mmetsp:Transcript_7923/g.13296  ORF Transcript_7923/g.13296 Transcript_7923/m.13296 type:complete len:360 (-) Transcript_7923:16-1095(-)